MSNNHVLEVVIFTVKPGYESRMPQLRAGLREAIGTFPGLLEYGGYYPLDNSRTFADVVKWDSYENAISAAQTLEKGGPQFEPFLESIEGMTFMGHFSPEPV